MSRAPDSNPGEAVDFGRVDPGTALEGSPVNRTTCAVTSLTT